LARAILQRGEGVAVHDRSGVTRAAVERVARDDANLAVAIGARTEEAHGGLDDEVALDLLRREVELIECAPHVRTSARQGVALVGRVVERVAGELRAADVLMQIKSANRFHLSSGGVSRGGVRGAGSTVEQDGKNGGKHQTRQSR